MCVLVARKLRHVNANCMSIFIKNIFFFNSQYYKDLQAFRHGRDILRHSLLGGRVTQEMAELQVSLTFLKLNTVNISHSV